MEKLDKIDTDYTEDIVCPWCGYKHEESWEFDDDGDDECANCGQPFFYSREVTVTYSTHRVNIDNCPRCGNKEKLTKYRKHIHHYTYVCERCNDELIREQHKEILRRIESRGNMG